jgi:hypothetical protein
MLGLWVTHWQAQCVNRHTYKENPVSLTVHPVRSKLHVTITTENIMHRF